HHEDSMFTQRRMNALALLLSLITPAFAAGQSASAPITQASPEQLRGWLKQYPDADANRDGTLTVEEAEAYRQKLVGRQVREAGESGVRHEYTFATMSDGVRIALAVGYPKDFDPNGESRQWPAIFMTCGYTSATTPVDPAGYGEQCVTVVASLRGTGASGGELSPWRPRTWQDGYEIIENWIVKQPWSNGRVGIEGYSWPGLMGFLTATTNPPSLKAVCVGGLIDDFYRGICYPGGVRNSGFPVDWLNNYYRADGPFGSGAAAMQARGLDDAAYGAIAEGRPVRDLTRDILWDLLHEPLDGPKWHVQNLATYAEQIRAPIMIGHAWQDEQTGPGGWQLWKRVPEDVPKRLFLTNGNHGVGPTPGADRDAWFAQWLLDRPDAEAVDPARRVECYFETRCEVRGGPGIRGEPLFAADFPLPGTRFTRYYLREGGALSTNSPPADEAADRYAVTHAPPSGAESRVLYRLPFEEPAAICGPAVLSLWATLTTIDTDFYVLLADEAPDGTFYGLQRGLLRASHRAIDPERSDYVECDGARQLIRPHHPHTSLQPVAPQEATEYQIEIPSLGHVFRPGHKLALVIMRPIEGDWIGVTKSGAPSYRYDSHPPPGTVTILHDAAHPSSLLLPVLPELPPLPDPPVTIDQQAGLQPAGDRDAVR
ncbi:MAG: CocE/NonD family hydrolase, partial [Pirellulaceae bacterium]|nr:CocE/NonD family hydrolase [Pirellulaceae bacterium]